MDFYFLLTLIRLPPNRPSLLVEREKRVSQYTNEKITGTITDEQNRNQNLMLKHNNGSEKN